MKRTTTTEKREQTLVIVRRHDGATLTRTAARDAAVGTLTSGGWYQIEIERSNDHEVRVKLTHLDHEPYRNGCYVETRTD